VLSVAQKKSTEPRPAGPEISYEVPKRASRPLSLRLNDHTDRGMGGRQYGTSEDNETLQG
jgi:hypothetical protein